MSNINDLIQIYKEEEQEIQKNKDNLKNLINELKNLKKPVIKFKKLKKDAILPTKGSLKAAGYDLYANLNENNFQIINSKESIKISTGIAAAIPQGYVGLIFARSGLSTKKGLRPANCVGVIDSDYRGPIIVAVHNDSLTDQTIYNKDRIAQLVVVPYLSFDIEEVDELDETDRGVNGFGSTGK